MEGIILLLRNSLFLLRVIGPNSSSVYARVNTCLNSQFRPSTMRLERSLSVGNSDSPKDDVFGNRFGMFFALGLISFSQSS